MGDWDPEANELFLRASEAATPEDRAVLLDAACGSNAELRAEVEALLAAHALAGGFLESSPPGATLREDAVTRPESAAESVEARIGPYTLQQKLGEGGMGTVWAAEQHAPVRRRVALKLIKPGMDSQQVLRRFEAERQALALMDHPNIATVFDAGTTESGRPYFAMELVKGVPITRYCDEFNLSLRERLELFIPICRAIQHAHTKGVVHRDVKPSNVLVAVQDGRPVPKVIDFGVAKALHRPLSDRTVYTEVGGVVGTLEYMAPEQAELSALDVDTRADVYALGALLYELLTGSTPVDKKRLAAAGLAEVMRIIKEEEPPRPSTRLSESAETLPGLAAHRRTEPGRLAREVRGDLDWIAMKCLEKDRSRRYETANALARDVERHLADEPVEARPPGRGYRLKKFARRNRGPLAAAALVAVALVAGTAAATWQAVRATNAEALAERRYEKEREARKDADAARKAADAARADAVAQRKTAEAQKKAAETEADKAQAVADLLVEMIGKSSPYAGAGSDYTVRQMLDDFAARLDGDLAEKFQGRPKVEAAVRAVVGSTYTARNDGAKAAPHLRRTVELSRLGHAAPHAAALALVNWAWAESHQHNWAEAERLAREGLAAGRALDRQDVEASALKVLTNAAIRQGHDAEAEQLALRGLPLTEDDRYHRIVLLAQLSGIVQRQGRLGDAERYAREAIEEAERSKGPESIEASRAAMQLARILLDRGKAAEAEPVARRALATQRRQLGETNAETKAARELVAAVLAARGDADALARHRAEARQVDAARASAEAARARAEYVTAQQALGAALRAQGKPAEAEVAFREVGRLDPTRHEAHLELGLALAAQGNSEAAAAALREAVRLAPDSPAALGELAIALRAQGKGDEAKAFDLRRLEVQIGRANEAVAQRPGNGRVYRDRGYHLGRAGRFEEAVRDLDKAIALDPSDDWAYVYAGSIHLYLGDAEGYRRVCRAMAKRFERSEIPEIGGRLAKLSMLEPDPEADLELAARLAERTVALGELHPMSDWFKVTLGLAEYRRGRYDAAARALEGQPESGRTSHYGRGLAGLVLAMAEARLGRAGRAVEAYDKAQKRIGDLPATPGAVDLGSGFYDWCVYQVMLREARSELAAILTERQRAAVVLKQVAARAEEAGAAGRWADAAALHEGAVETAAGVSAAEEYLQWYRAACAWALSGDREAYDRLCRRMLDRYGPSADMQAAQLAARAALLLPGAPPDEDEAARLAARSVDAAGGRAAPPYNLLTRSLAEYRAGRHEQAIEWNAAALARGDMPPIRRAAHQFVQAMALSRLRRTGEARAALEEGLKLAPPGQPTLAGDPVWYLLRREAVTGMPVEAERPRRSSN